MNRSARPSDSSVSVTVGGSSRRATRLPYNTVNFMPVASGPARRGGACVVRKGSRGVQTSAQSVHARGRRRWRAAAAAAFPWPLQLAAFACKLGDHLVSTCTRVLPSATGRGGGRSLVPSQTLDSDLHGGLSAFNNSEDAWLLLRALASAAVPQRCSPEGCGTCKLGRLLEGSAEAR